MKLSGFSILCNLFTSAVMVSGSVTEKNNRRKNLDGARYLPLQGKGWKNAAGQKCGML
jgi:hypothetical protein